MVVSGDLTPRLSFLSHALTPRKLSRDHPLSTSGVEVLQQPPRSAPDPSSDQVPLSPPFASPHLRHGPRTQIAILNFTSVLFIPDFASQSQARRPHASSRMDPSCHQTNNHSRCPARPEPALLLLLLLLLLRVFRASRQASFDVWHHQLIIIAALSLALRHQGSVGADEGTVVRQTTGRQVVGPRHGRQSAGWAG